MSTDQPMLTEGDLLRRAQRGDESALEALYAAHLDPARRLAHILAGPSGAEDLVADAFARVLAQIRAGRGPSTNLRGYLFATIRNRHRDVLRRTNREAPVSDEPWLLDGEAESAEEMADGLDEGAAVAALGTLPDSWQQVLWHLEVEDRPVPEVATMLRMTPAAVSSLAYRAREGLRSAYLRHHLPRAGAGAPAGAQCTWTHERLAAYVRGGLSPRASARLETHLSSCAGCSTAAAELSQVNRRLAALAPLLLLGCVGLSAAPQQSPGPLSRELAARAGGAPAAPAAAVAPAAGAAGTAGGGVAGLVASSGLPGLITAACVALAAVVLAVTWWAVAAPTDDEPAAGSDALPSEPVDAGVATPSGQPDLPGDLPVDLVPGAPIPGAASSAPPSSPPDIRGPGRSSRPSAGTAPGSSPSSPALPSPSLPPFPAAVPVTASAPTATAISACGTYGALVLPTTAGISYTLVEGDGAQGPWRVTATALAGHVLAAGTPRSFSGDLGAHYACPRFDGVTLSPGDVVDTWRLDAPLTISGPARPLEITVRLGNDVLIPSGGVRGTGWACWGPDGTAGPQIGADQDFYFGAGFEMSCRYDFTGSQPDPLGVVLESFGQVPTGSLELSVGGVVHDSATY